MIVTAHIKFGLHSNFLDSMIQAEDVRLEGESIEDGTIRVYKKLENAVERLKKEAESFRGQIVTESLAIGRQPTPPPEHWEIQKDNEADDQLASAMKEIQKIQYKEDAEKFLETERWMKYDKTLRSLVNAKHIRP
jgi:hypothetical protein